MSSKPWKKFEKRAAELFGGKRFWANSGEKLDFEGEQVAGQCKLVQRLSLEELTSLAEEAVEQAKLKGKIGVVCVKVRRGRGAESPMLVVMTDDAFQDLFSLAFRVEYDEVEVEDENADDREP